MARGPEIKWVRTNNYKFHTFHLVHFRLSLSPRPSFQISEGLVLRLADTLATWQLRQRKEVQTPCTVACMEGRILHVFKSNNYIPYVITWLYSITGSVEIPTYHTKFMQKLPDPSYWDVHSLTTVAELWVLLSFSLATIAYFVCAIFFWNCLPVHCKVWVTCNWNETWASHTT